MSRIYSFVPRISRHRVNRMPRLVTITSASGTSGSAHLHAARGILVAGAACAVFWVVALSTVF